MEGRRQRVVIIPVVGMSDWRIDAPLDFEETLTLRLLSAALAKAPDPSMYLSIPPVRFTLGRRGRSFFTVDAETAHATLEDIAASVKESGFRKLLFLNSSPWNEELVDAAGRDLRIKLGLEPFCISLTSIGVNLHDPKYMPVNGDSSGAALGAAAGPGPNTGPLPEAADQLFTLLEEVRAFRPLPEDGFIPNKVGLC